MLDDNYLVLSSPRPNFHMQDARLDFLNFVPLVIENAIGVEIIGILFTKHQVTRKFLTKDFHFMLVFLQNL